MIRFPIIACITAGILALSGCARQEPIDPRTVLTRAQLDQVEEPFKLAILPSIGAFSSLALVAENDGVRTWETPDDITVSFKDGVIVSTRGLAQDMMTSDVSNTLAAIDGRIGGYYTRFQGSLGGQSEIVYRTFQCRVTARVPEAIVIIGRTHQTTRIVETCASPGLEVTNVYWRGNDGVMWKSRQWIGEKTEYLETERLVL